MTTSEYLNENQIKGLLKAGDVILPGADKSPSFSQTGCIEHIDRIAAFLDPDDLNGLRLVLSLFRWSPRWFIALLMTMCDHNRLFPGFLGAAFRMLDIGVKGATMSPYYSNLTGADYYGDKVFDIIGWDAKIIVRNEHLEEN